MASLPSGTVTFLFTDIEGSTRRWEAEPAAMRVALAQHNDIVREAIEDFGGTAFKFMGDAIFAAFMDPHDAVAAALTAQRDLAREDFGVAGTLRVRMALHSGVADGRDGDYTGPALNRVARLLAAGHGGQVLLSAATQELVRDALPTGVGLKDAGTHRLKDLFRPEHIYQLTAPGLDTDVPTLRTLDARPNNLLAQPTPLIGREREIAAISAMLSRDDVRLVTLTGSGGTGKTRLSMQAAADMLDMFDDGVWFIDLAPITDPAMILSAIAGTLHVRESGEQPVVATLIDYLSRKHLLLVLDNVEQVVEGAHVVGQLLAACPNLRIIATSRVPLGLRSEREYPVPTLALPGTRITSIDILSQYDAVRLFIERAQAVKPDFIVTNANAPAVAEISVRLDGLPLAIELAAARIRTLSPDAMLERLDHRLSLLTGGRRDLPVRQQTLRNTIAWSYDLLSASEQRLFRTLSVFRGGWTLDAAESVVDAADAHTVLDGLDTLVSHSLVRAVEQADGLSRFAMLEMIREFGLERLTSATEDGQARSRHAAVVVEKIHAIQYGMTEHSEADRMREFEAEQDNVRAALECLLGRASDGSALRLAVDMASFWDFRGHLHEAERWIQAALEQDSTADPKLRADGHGWMTDFLYQMGRYDEAQVQVEQSLSLYREVNNPFGILNGTGGLALLAEARGDLDRAVAYHRECLTAVRIMQNVNAVGNVLSNLGFTLILQGQYEMALPVLHEALDLLQQFGEDDFFVQAQISLGWIALVTSSVEQAREHLTRALTAVTTNREPIHTADTFEGIAALAVSLDRSTDAARLHGAAQRLRTDIGARISPPAETFIMNFFEPVQRQMGAVVWQEAAVAGQRMTIEEAMGLATSVVNSTTTPAV